MSESLDTDDAEDVDCWCGMDHATEDVMQDHQYFFDLSDEDDYYSMLEDESEDDHG